jgi:hypothetical protein
MVEYLNDRSGYCITAVAVFEDDEVAMALRSGHVKCTFYIRGDKVADIRTTTSSC